MRMLIDVCIGRNLRSLRYHVLVMIRSIKRPSVGEEYTFKMWLYGISKKWKSSSFLWCYVLFGIFNVVTPCGTSTHIHIAHESKQFFTATGQGKINYGQLINRHQDAFVAGNPFPDAMYTSLCFGGKYHGIAEDTHWAPFLNATVNYIRKHFPLPWDQDTEKLVAFLFGFVSHQVADVSWHSLGIDQGFLRTMAYMNFHANYEVAHSTGDAGGDMISQYEGDDQPIGNFKWYVPTKDLAKIYKEYYGEEKVSSNVIGDCSMLLYIEWLAEKVAGGKLFPFFGRKSPFLMEQLHTYFLGGIHDMAAWTTLTWNLTATMLDKGTSVCHIPKNPLFITCQGNQFPRRIYSEERLSYPGKRRLFRGDVGNGHVLAEETDRGITFSPGPNFVRKLRHEELQRHARGRQQMLEPMFRSIGGESLRQMFLLTTQSPYSEAGSFMTSWTVSPTEQFLAFAAPHSGSPGDASRGKVYVVNKTSLKLPNTVDPVHYLEKIAVKVLDGSSSMERFGSSLAIIDFNKDGIDDLAVGAPSHGAKDLMYVGAVYIYLGKPSSTSVAPDIVIYGTKKYHNFGFQLKGFDLDGDGFNDLVVSSPFAPGGGQQRGMVHVFFSRSGIKAKIHLTASQADININGTQDYEWFGYAVDAAKLEATRVLIVGAPGFRLCSNCSSTFKKDDVQEAGRIYMYGIQASRRPRLFVTINGTSEFSKFGFSLAVGDPLGAGKKTILAVGAPSRSVKGYLVDLLPTTFIQAGSVYLYNLTFLMDLIKGRTVRRVQPITRLDGDRNFGGLGWSVKFDHFKSDDYDDLFIAQPFFTKDITEELRGGEEGAVYNFQGGPQFPLGLATKDCGLSSVIPCPAKKATFYIYGNEKTARLGRTLHVTTLTGIGKTLLAGSPRSNTGSFHGGNIVAFAA